MAKESLLGSTRPGIKLERYGLKDQDERGIWTSGYREGILIVPTPN
jgi:hypothetical protein